LLRRWVDCLVAVVRLLGILAAALVGVIIPPGSATAATVSHQPSVSAFVYNGQHSTDQVSSTLNERGPPLTTRDQTAPTSAVDHASIYGPTRPQIAGAACTTYDPDLLPAQVDGRSGTPRMQAETSSGVLRLVSGSRVAANGVPPRSITTGAGTTIDRLAINTSISARRQGRHVLGARQYGGGSYFNSADDAQRVLDDFQSGAAQVLGVKGNNIVVRAPNVTGFNHNPGAGLPNQATNVFFIKGSSSPSVVSYNPAWTP
jgi:hypothetical protein